MPYRDGDRDEVTAASLYRRAYDAHYKRRDRSTAKGAYMALIERFPTSPEARYAKTQLENIDQQNRKHAVMERSKTPAEKRVETFRCTGCDHTGCSHKRVFMGRPEDGPSLALACLECGLTVFYDLLLLEKQVQDES